MRSNRTVVARMEISIFFSGIPLYFVGMKNDSKIRLLRLIEIKRLLLCKVAMHNDHGPNSITADLGQITRHRTTILLLYIQPTRGSNITSQTSFTQHGLPYIVFA